MSLPHLLWRRLFMSIHRGNVEILDRSFQYFLDHQNQLVEKYMDKFVVIVGEEVVGAYGSHQEAVSEALKKHERGTFIVQECKPGPEAYTLTFHSRVRLESG